ncbi:isochorismatase family protein [Streptacidiphilus sp. PB12-B1b]|uniref:isochorismatase family protein n=1 Tax=Streptacidiphilus sp. PB12-B1b TaxID=2705012 RepID=UPI0015FBA8B0|nr:isochorismatase family protein [Streptacidiphilus sp. PB12-B1b]QMU78662.1 isochorismatase family protein [Streptacidiphilus sp. PB12-B1b]
MSRALIVIDVQDSFRVRPDWEHTNNPGITDKVNRLVRLARDAGDTVVWVLHSEPGSGDVFDPALGHVRLMAGLEQHEDDLVVLKTSHNAFTTTNLQQELTLRGVRELTTCGIRTEQCVETTTRVASDLGYQVTFVSDATGTHPITRDGVTLPAEEIVRRTEFVLADRFATVTTVDALEQRAREEAR